MNEEFQKFLDNHDLPEPPDESCENVTEVAELVISRFHGEKIYSGYTVHLSDAQEYCSRDDTHGDGWFVMWYGR